MRTLMMFGMATVLVAALSFGSVVAKPAQAQVVATGDLLVLVDVEVGECGTGNCPEGQRPVTVTPVLDLDLDAVVGADILNQALDAALNVAVFDDVTITDAQGNVVATVAPGDTVCLEPGTFTASTSLLNADAVVDAINVLGIGITIEDVIVIEETFTVQQCPAEGGPGAPGSDNVQNIDLNAGNCAVIIANAGVQYGDNSVVQTCQQIINNITAGGDVNSAINGDATSEEVEDDTGDSLIGVVGDPATTAGGSDDGGTLVSTSESDDSGSGSEDGDSSSGAEGQSVADIAGLSVLPDTGGLAIPALLAGAFMICGGLLFRRYAR